jgi:hypothetical protein
VSGTDPAHPESLNTRLLSGQFIFIALALGTPFGIAGTPWMFRDGDTSWQVAAGEWILTHAKIPTTDPFSYTAAGHPWVAMEWLAEVVFAAAYRLAGNAGLAAVVAGALIALHVIIYFYLERRVPLVVLAAALILMDFVLAAFVLARPHVLAWPIIGAWTVTLLRAAENCRAPPLWTVLLLVVWTNLHASYPLAVLIAGAIGLDALIAARWATFREWAVFGGASLIAISMNANGVAGLLQPFRTSSLAMLPLLAEWHRSTPHATPFFFAVLLIAVGALLWTRTRVPIGRLVLLVMLVLMALDHVRHQALLAIVATCILPPLWRPRRSRPTVPKWLLLAAVPMLAFRAIWPLELPESEANPNQLIAAVPASLRARPVFNGYIFGGPLILAGIKPYIDGRAEIYGDDFVANYVSITTGDMSRFNGAVRQYGIQWAILPRTNTRLIKAIESSGEWHRIYADPVGIIDVRNGS